MGEMRPTGTLVGLTWGHRRAIAPLKAVGERFAARTGGARVDWAVRDLRAFEHQPITEAARLCDLLVFDHPFTGEIAESGLFRPLDDIIGSVSGASRASDHIGPSLQSYRWGGSSWGAPIDGATMNALYRKDLLHRLDPSLPVTWEEVMKLARSVRKEGLWMGMANGDHHGFLAVGSFMHNLGAPWAASPEAALSFDLGAFEVVLDALAELAAHSHPDCGAFNSIALHDAMASRDDLVYCPSVFGYATYGEEDHAPRRLSFGPAPGMVAPFDAGTLLGGTGVAVSAACRNQELAKAYVAFLLKPETQMSFADHHGQPALLGAWTNPAIDERFNGYFSATRTTIEAAATRPRFKGYGIFEHQAGLAVGRFLRREETKSRTLEALRKLSDRWTAVMS